MEPMQPMPDDMKQEFVDVCNEAMLDEAFKEVGASPGGFAVAYLALMTAVDAIIGGPGADILARVADELFEAYAQGVNEDE